MEIGAKEIISIVVYAVTVAVLWTRFMGDLNNHGKDIEKLSNFFKRVAIDENGNIKLVNHVYCAKQKKELLHQIEISRKSTTQALEKLNLLDKKITLIMFHLKIPDGSDDFS
jgi:hypothetical protein